MSFEWDSRKAAANLQKHGVDFADAATVFEDDNAITVQDTHPASCDMSRWAWTPLDVSLWWFMRGEARISD